MILISLNIRGVGGLLKLASLRRLLDKHRPTVIFLQETLVDAEVARNFFFALRPDWMACAASSIGTSGGLLAAWDPLYFDFTPMLSPGGILLTGTCLELNTSLTLLNTYGPCLERRLFWEKLDRLGLLAIKDLIIAGDLNLTLSSKEIWGDKAKTDPLATFFTSLFTKNALVDLEPAELLPTWRNGRAGSSGIEKRLNAFLISEDLLNPSHLARAWIDLPYLSDHTPICLQLGKGNLGSSYPFKFNSAWLLEPAFDQIVRSVWSDSSHSLPGDAQGNLVRKLKCLKANTISWLKRKKAQDATISKQT
jgi:hypothetical protein